MISLWWWALPVLLLPVWWHRQKKERTNVQLLATARFLPRTSPQQQRVWRWRDVTLMLLRCLLLATVIAWLADMVIAWRGDAVLIAPGSDRVWVDKQIVDAGFTTADKIDVPSSDVFGWLARHEREWKADARLLVLGNVSMPAERPRLAHAVHVRSKPAALAGAEIHVAIVSARPARWRALFAALDGPQRFVIAADPSAKSELIIWDRPEAPTSGVKAPLWWIGDATAFPELKNAKAVDGIGYADSARGRLWASDRWPAESAEAARAQFESWQRLHYAAPPYVTPAQTIAASATAAPAPASGALRYLLTIALLVLFALERIVTHATRR